MRVVGHLEPVGEAHVDLVLRGPDLVVGVLHRDAELAQREHHVAAEVRRHVERRQVEVAALVEDLRALVVLEQEELELGPQVVVVEAHVLRARERPPHHEARVALVGLAAGLEHVAEHAPDLVGLAGPPGQDLERARVGHGDHVRLLDPVEAGDRRAVEAHAVLERPGSSSLPTANDLSWPKMSVNQNRTNSTFSLLDLGEHLARAGRLLQCCHLFLSCREAPAELCPRRDLLRLVRLEDLLALLAGADPDGLLDRQDEQLPVADRARSGRAQDRLLDQADVLVLDHALELQLRPQVDRRAPSRGSAR